MRSRVGGWILGVAGVALAFLLASASSATLFTLAADVNITGSESGNTTGIVGTFRPIFDLSTTLPLAQSDGSIDLVNDDVFVVDFVLTSFASGSGVDQIGITPTVCNPAFLPGFCLPGPPEGAGAFDDTASGDIAPSNVTADAAGFRGLYDFSTPLAAGETTVRLFVTYDPALYAIQNGELVNFMISPGTNFTVQGSIIPEPGTLLLLGAGLAALGVGPRRRKRAA